MSQALTQLEAIEKRTQQCFASSKQAVEAAVELLEKAARDLQDSDAVGTVLNELEANLKQLNMQHTIAHEFKELYAGVTKLGKTTDKNVNRDLDSVCKPQVMDTTLLNSVILQQFFRDGRIALANKLVQETKLDGVQTGERFAEMHDMVAALRRRDVTPCLRWVERHANAIGDEATDLSFNLHRLHFLQLLFPLPPLSPQQPSPSSSPPALARTESIIALSNSSPAVARGHSEQNNGGSVRSASHSQDGGPVAMEMADGATPPPPSSLVSTSTASPGTASGAASPVLPDCASALAYAQKQFPPYAHAYMKEIQQLTSCLLFASSLSTCPYGTLFDGSLWEQAEKQFTRECCKLMGLPERSPLTTALTASDAALPKLIKFASVLKHKGDLIKQQDAMPVDIDLGKQFQFHSTFVCPVSKEHTSSGNPPVMLACGHVISKHAMERIGRHSRSNRTFKCPYCPREQAPSDVKLIHF